MILQQCPQCSHNGRTRKFTRVALTAKGAREGYDACVEGSEARERKGGSCNVTTALGHGMRRYCAGVCGPKVWWYGGWFGLEQEGFGAPLD